MALVVADRVKETTSTSGTGTLTLDGAALGFQSFAVVGTGNTTYYAIVESSGTWEVGIGTYTSGGTRTLSRDTLIASSTGSLLTLGSGSKDVFVTLPAGKAVITDVNKVYGNNNFYRNDKTISVNTTIGSTENVSSAGPMTIADGITVTISDGGEWVIV